MNTPGKSKPNRRNSWAPYSNKRRDSSGCFSPFKSPCSNERKIQTPKRLDSVGTSCTKVEVAHEVVQLQQQCEKLDEEIESLSSEYNEEELPQYIDKLHEYNEIKDIAQMIIGKIAEKKGTTTKSLYTEFNLELDD